MAYPTTRIDAVAPTDPMRISYNTPSEPNPTPKTFNSRDEMSEFFRMVRGTTGQGRPNDENDWVIPPIDITDPDWANVDFTVEYRSGGVGPWVPIDPRG